MASLDGDGRSMGKHHGELNWGTGERRNVWAGAQANVETSELGHRRTSKRLNWGTGERPNFVSESSQPTEEVRGSLRERELREASFEQNAWDTLVCNGFLEVYLPHTWNVGAKPRYKK
jgi:hypothetical protein